MRKSRFNIRSFRSQAGTTLLEVLVATGILAVTAIGMSQFYANSIKAQKKIKVLAAMEFISDDIDNKLKSPSSIYLSLLDTTNIQLIQCVLGTGSGCTSTLTTTGSRNYFALNYSTAVLAKAQMSNPNATAMLYNTDGVLCAGALNTNAPCAFQVQTFFYATCDATPPATPPSTCTQGPGSISVGYTVTQVPGSLPSFGNAFPTLPKSVHFFTHQTTDILGSAGSATCNPGAVINGYDRSGYAKCQCVSPYIESSNYGPNRYGPICRKLLSSELTCPSGTIFRGLNSDGTAMCLSPSAAYTCVYANPIGNLAAQCPAGYWVNTDVRSSWSSWQQCTYNCTLPDLQGGSYDCGSDEGSDPRLGGGMQGLVKYSSGTKISPNYNTYNVSDDENSNAVSLGSATYYKRGLVCPTRFLTCCTTN